MAIKPTTAKQAIAYFEADDLFYVTKPDIRRKGYFVAPVEKALISL